MTWTRFGTCAEFPIVLNAGLRWDSRVGFSGGTIGWDSRVGLSGGTRVGLSGQLQPWAVAFGPQLRGTNHPTRPWPRRHHTLAASALALNPTVASTATATHACCFATLTDLVSCRTRSYEHYSDTLVAATFGRGLYKVRQCPRQCTSQRSGSESQCRRSESQCSGSESQCSGSESPVVPPRPLPWPLPSPLPHAQTPDECQCSNMNANANTHVDVCAIALVVSLARSRASRPGCSPRASAHSRPRRPRSRSIPPRRSSRCSRACKFERCSSNDAVRADVDATLLARERRGRAGPAGHARREAGGRCRVERGAVQRGFRLFYTYSLRAPVQEVAPCVCAGRRLAAARTGVLNRPHYRRLGVSWGGAPISTSFLMYSNGVHSTVLGSLGHAHAR